MNKNRLNTLLWLSPCLLGTGLLMTGSARADEVLTNDLAANPAMEQVTSVSQLSDVKPTDWAFQALQSLVERYGCIAGYPDRTYRGNRAMTRYEFAAGVNACMDRVNELIAAATADLVKKEDLATLQKLQEEFAAELATLRGRVDALEAKTATLEKQQFSTTTKLSGEVVVGRGNVMFGESTGLDALGVAVPGVEPSRNSVVGYRARLNLDTSFTGKDLLRTRIQAGNLGFSQDATGIPEGSLRLSADSGNSAVIDALLYQFPLGEKTTVVVEANAGAADDFTDTLNPYLDGDGGSGALSHFGTRNPIYYLLGGTGIAVKHEFSEQLELSAGYLAGDAANPASGSGLFNGPYGAIAQLTFKPSEQLKVGLTYVHSYKTTFNSAGSPTGSLNANLLVPTDSDGDLVNDTFDTLGSPFSSNSFGVGASFQISPKIVLNGSVGYTKTRVLKGTRGDLDIWNWMVGLAFPDLGKTGAMAGVIVGMEPKVTGTSAALSNLRDRDTSLHVEAFYQYPLNDNIAITPGLIWLTSPNHDNRNDSILIGTLRTTFTF
ncbi:iron uptake porin [Alkalinema pantanalense CENA528]|uniref:iron uptake porin n=1 Tax=Alkalinema pantanalense TaxID=1620705 RepID=UPI003D6F28BB